MTNVSVRFNRFNWISSVLLVVLFSALECRGGTVACSDDSMCEWANVWDDDIGVECCDHDNTCSHDCSLELVGFYILVIALPIVFCGCLLGVITCVSCCIINAQKTHESTQAWRSDVSANYGVPMEPPPYSS
ncbi:uncharacterized protein LOC134852810 [Symsagittifera roscoffensis]|uniref:uncharacterized protein LOC134852810 n=1 Tax=Symsagittifera roscoffensis TaxID=84072 RepID=UPI00307CC269